MILRDRRIQNEWQALCTLAAENSSIICSVNRQPSEFVVLLQNSPAWVSEGEELKTRSDHKVRYRFPDYYPQLPIEAYFALPVFHPNVDPLSGFACLWLDHNPSHNIIDAIVITRALMAHRTRNPHAAHVLQPDALSVGQSLAMPSLRISPELHHRTVLLPGRRSRLSDL